jgi:pyruvate-ferredoxin/flavodoxin oxidoreductase
LGWFREELGDFKFALTRPYYDLHEKDQPNSGGLFSITINPTTCKGCMECVEVCNDDALRIVTQTEESIVANLRKNGTSGQDLPNTPPKSTTASMTLKKRSVRCKPCYQQRCLSEALPVAMVLV